MCRPAAEAAARVLTRQHPVSVPAPVVAGQEVAGAQEIERGDGKAAEQHARAVVGRVLVRQQRAQAALPVAGVFLGVEVHGDGVCLLGCVPGRQLELELELKLELTPGYCRYR